jgi:hypothetical protein
MSATKSQNDCKKEIELLRSSPILLIYLSEMVQLLDLACQELDAARALVAANPPRGEIMPVALPEFHYRVQAALMALGSFIHFIKVPDPATRKARTRDFMRAGRAKLLMRCMHGADISEIEKVEVRHRLEHVDDYLDQVALRLPAPGDASERTWVAQNLILTDPEHLLRLDPSFKGFVGLRVYYSSSDTYHQLGSSIYLGRLRVQAGSARMLLQRSFDAIAPKAQVASEAIDPRQRRGVMLLVDLKPEDA